MKGAWVSSSGLTDDQHETLRAIFATPVGSGVSWLRVKDLLAALGGRVKEYENRICVVMRSDHRAIIHCYDKHYASSFAMQMIREFLETVGVGLD